MKKILLLTSTILLSVAPIATVVSCKEKTEPTIQAWDRLNDGILSVTMEDEYSPYNFAISNVAYGKILEQSTKSNDLELNDGMTPFDAKKWIEMIHPVDINSPDYSSARPFVGGIDPYMTKKVAESMSTSSKQITTRIYLQKWKKIKEGWSYDKDAVYKDENGNNTNEKIWPKDDTNEFDMVISAMAPDDDKKTKHSFTNEYLLTENVLIHWDNIDRLDAQTIANWKNLTDAEKRYFGKIAIENFPDSDPDGSKYNVAVKYFGRDWVEPKGDLNDVYEAILAVDNKYAFIEDIQAEEFTLETRGLIYSKGLFPKEPKVKSAMSVKPGTPKFVLNHINSFLTEEIDLAEQDRMKKASIKMNAYCLKNN